MTKITRTWRVEAETVARLEALSERLGVFYSPTVDLLLTTALDRLDAGRWVLKTRPGRPILDGLQETNRPEND